jgi:hypothetical protein
MQDLIGEDYVAKEHMPSNNKKNSIGASWCGEPQWCFQKKLVMQIRKLH